ncbi:hypothetical protein CKA32_006435 [Geitlerinema sp. FC II]|nr:hypothetical protein CKA32_006435 [Geitlerinema sp. FC II]
MRKTLMAGSVRYRYRLWWGFGVSPPSTPSMCDKNENGDDRD